MSGVVDNLVVLRLTDSSREGEWIALPPGQRRLEVIVGPPPGWLTGEGDSGERVPTNSVWLVPTGDVEWDGDRCAEVWVPEARLPHWIAEFRTDSRATTGEDR